MTEDFISQLKKAELHIHLEGALEPELMMALAKRNRVNLPYADVEDIRRAYDFTNLQDFLDLYYAGTSALVAEEDFFELADTYFKRVQADGATHVEAFFDPQAHTERGIPIEVVMEGFLRAAATARERGLEAGLILCFLRHLDETAAFEALAAAEPWRDKLLGVGLDSSEVGHPPTKFARVFREAGDLGYRRVAHAGEEGPPEYVWQALDELGVERIDHGNRALEDASLVARLRSEAIPLTVCPLSNLKLCVVDSLDAHPVPAMLDAGLVVTLNSDDPAYFGGYLNDNYSALAKHLALDNATLAELAENSLRSRFL